MESAACSRASLNHFLVLFIIITTTIIICSSGSSSFSSHEPFTVLTHRHWCGAAFSVQYVLSLSNYCRHPEASLLRRLREEASASFLPVHHPLTPSGPVAAHSTATRTHTPLICSVLLCSALFFARSDIPCSDPPPSLYIPPRTKEKLPSQSTLLLLLLLLPFLLLQRGERNHKLCDSRAGLCLCACA